VMEAQRRDQVVSKLHDILRPFLLRRLKIDVEHSLPLKKEILLYAQMTPAQRKLNEAMMDKTIGDVLNKMTDGSKSRAALNNVIMQLRKVCNHPDLITGGLDGDHLFPSADVLVEQCGKMQLLDRMLMKLKAKGHKVLIFSQMTKMLDLLEIFLNDRGHSPCRIDGSIDMDTRRDQIKRFNEDKTTFVFLLSTRAGGLGINLTAADTCIIYDSDWNPHQDMQAMDRCHRIGQTRPVHVYRLATANSVEGRMLAKAASKLMLERLVVSAGGFHEVATEKQPTQLTAEELMEVIRGIPAAALTKNKMSDADIAQSGDISEETLERLFDRSDMLKGHVPKAGALPPCGVGYQTLVEPKAGGLLASVGK
jgi:ATP-dependent DNA helicase